jgi:formate hydrogenlyase subunit 3/multisubunit Na+/H+ antiporter MnhD subunit
MFFEVFCFFSFLTIIHFFTFNNSINMYMLTMLSTALLYFFFNFSDVTPVQLNFNFFEISIFITVFVTFLTFFLLILTRSPKVIKVSTMHLFVLFFITFGIVHSNSLIIIFFFFELLLLISINLLRVTSKSERVLEAVNEMYFWTLFGSLFLIIGVFYFYALNNHFLFLNNVHSDNLLSFFFVIGFGVKVPLWPFTSWLLKAHVEASTEFSILLSGFIIKLGIVCLIKILEIIGNDASFSILFYLAFIGIIDACVKLLYQQDLKKIVALTTVIEVNWLVMCYSLGGSALIFLSGYLLVVHSFTTILEFLLVESISKRYGSRDINYINGMWFHTPNLWYMSLFTVLITIGFPGSSIFFAKLIFFSALLQFSVFYFTILLLLFFLVLPVYFIRLWLPLWFGLTNNAIKFDLSKKEFFVFSVFVLLNVILGFYPALIVL